MNNNLLKCLFRFINNVKHSLEMFLHCSCKILTKDHNNKIKDIQEKV